MTGFRAKTKRTSDPRGVHNVALERWLRNNPTASAGDRAAAENVVKDLKNALGRN